MNIKKLVYSVLATSIIAIFATPANATLVLTLNAGGTNVVTVTDTANTGSVSYFGALGAWLFNITGGVSTKTGANAVTSLDLTSLNVSGGAGTLIITLTDNSFTSPSGIFSSISTQFGGVAGGTISLSSLLNGISVSSFFAGSGPFSGSNNAIANTTGGFSLSQIATITHKIGGNTSLNVITAVPEPATLGLLGLGLIGLGFMKRRFMV